MSAPAPDAFPPNPHLSSPILFCSGFSSSTADEALVDALKDCLRCRLSIDRSSTNPAAPASGKIEFESLYKAELAYATCNHQRLSSSSTLELALSPSGPSSDPSPAATPRLIKQLPLSTTAASLFALCRPFGPVHSLALLLAPVPPHAPTGSQPRFKGHALVTYYTEADAHKMHEGLHFAEIGGQNVAVSLWDEKRGERAAAEGGRRSDASVSAYSTPGRSPRQVQNGFDPAAAAASPGASPSLRTSRWAADQSASPAAAPSTPSRYAGLGLGVGLSAGAREFSPGTKSEAMGRSVSGASQWSVGSAGGDAPSTPTSGAVDPCNLFIKSLPSSLLSPHLHALFSPFGQIVSARVMADPSTGASREFGFVSFTTPDAAESARRGMDGQWVWLGPGEAGEEEVKVGEEARGREGARRVTVRVHERKEARQARLSEGGVREIEKGVAGLSAASTPDRPSPASHSPSASRWASPSSAAPAANGAVAPAPHSPSTPVSPPSPAEDAPLDSKKSEHERLLEGVRKVLSAKGREEETDEVVGLIESLPKKERAMCLFNPSVLAQKVDEALAIVSVSSDEEDTPAAPAPPVPSSTAPTTVAPLSLDDLAALPSSAVLSSLRSAPSSALPAGVSAPNPAQERETTAFMDALEGKPVHEVKQKLGERVFKALKKEGVKGAPRITIDLLDSEPDLRALAHLVEVPVMLKAKAEAVAARLKAAK
ncbi:hypothetical protein JCM8097_006770 [Rhodosporidiobolus ruineniae]